jgi:glycosyltransferase involved in cell wall biosynthesis
MRVANFIFEDRIVGPVKRIINLGKLLDGYGVETILCIPDRHGYGEEYAKKRGVNVVRVKIARIPKPDKFLGILKWFLLQPLDVARICSLLKSIKPDIVHVNAIYFLAPVLSAKLLGIPVVWHLNDILLKGTIARFAKYLPIFLADQIVVSSKAVATHFGLKENDYEILYAPVDTAYLKNTLRSPESNKYRIGIISNWIPIKGHEYFIRAMYLLKEKLGKRELEIILAGAEFDSHSDFYENMQSLIDELGLRPNITDMGFVENVREFFSEIDICCMCSVSEAFPMVVLEAIAAGLPLIATNVGGVPEILLRNPSEPAGIMVPPRDPEAIADKILCLIDHPDYAKKLSLAGPKIAEKNFDISIFASHQFGIYSKIYHGNKVLSKALR